MSRVANVTVIVSVYITILSITTYLPTRFARGAGDPYIYIHPSTSYTYELAT